MLRGMFDSRFLAFAGFAALLVLTPGATLAVALDSAIDGGRRAGLWTVAGIGSANAALGLAAAFGLSTVFHRVPAALPVVTVAGACYLGFLGVHSLVRAWRPVRPAARLQAGRPAPSPRSGSPPGHFTRGLVTNLLNPSVSLFYAAALPQFIGAGDPFRARFLVLAFTHVAMSIVWMGAVALSVGAVSERLARPAVRRAMETMTGLALVALGLRLLLR
jgi:threonine/homoserine/homoserine lactone efflux protein